MTPRGCLRHIRDSISTLDYKLAILRIEMLVAQECHKTVIKTIDERHQAALTILNAPLAEPQDEPSEAP